jgi:hypothetical protein
MSKLLLAAAAVAASALFFTAPATAGCLATVGLAPPPKGTSAGDVWLANLTILQHGRNPLPDARNARPTVTIHNRATGEEATFVARVSDASRGTYVARVVFPSGGTWSYEVFDDFTSWGGEKAPCAQTHTFAAVEIAGARGSGGGAPPRGSSFPVWPLIGGALALVAGALALVLARGRLGSREAAPTA